VIAGKSEIRLLATYMLANLITKIIV